MKLTAEISNPKTHQRLKMKLPATYSTIEDALQRLGCDETVTMDGRILDEYGRGAGNFYFENSNIFELNQLAELTQHFEDDASHAFIGGYFLMSKDGMTLAKTINLAMNIKSNNLVFCQPARDERDLAEFYLENDLIPELKDVADEAYQWIVDHTDLESLGEEILQNENGTFISGAYVTMDELEQLYDGSFRMPIPESYIFKLEVGFNPKDDDGSRYTLPLPTSHSEIDRMMSEMEVKSLSELTCYKCQSIVPLLEPMDFDMTDIHTLNQLATSIAYFKETGEFITYKAMVDALEVIDLEAVNQLCEYVGDFELQESARSFSAYGKSKFQGTVPDELLQCIDTDDYGTKMTEKDGVSMTSYGALVPKDGEPLLEKMTQIEHTQTTGMEMTM